MKNPANHRSYSGKGQWSIAKHNSASLQDATDQRRSRAGARITMGNGRREKDVVDPYAKTKRGDRRSQAELPTGVGAASKGRRWVVVSDFQPPGVPPGLTFSRSFLALTGASISTNTGSS